MKQHVRSFIFTFLLEENHLPLCHMKQHVRPFIFTFLLEENHLPLCHMKQHVRPFIFTFFRVARSAGDEHCVYLATLTLALSQKGVQTGDIAYKRSETSLTHYLYSVRSNQLLSADNNRPHILHLL